MKREWNDLRTTAHAWQLCPNEIPPRLLLERYLAWLSSEERSRYEEFRTESSRRDYLAVRALCRATLSRYADVDPCDWVFGKGPHGKPMILGPAEFKSARFSLTHTRGLTICLLSRASEVGVDTEEISRVVDVAQVARHFLSRREQERLENLPAHDRLTSFFDQWVSREAYLKAIGRGIVSAPERFTITFDESGQPLPIGNWRVFLHRPSPHHVAAAAVRRRSGVAPISVQWLKADDLIQPESSMLGFHFSPSTSLRSSGTPVTS